MSFQGKVLCNGVGDVQGENAHGCCVRLRGLPCNCSKEEISNFFSAPKSWPNKVLINVWGAFSVIFVASYTANIAALFAGLFSARFRHIQDKSLLSIPVGCVKGSAAEFYVSKVNSELVQHMWHHTVQNFTEGSEKLRNGSLELLLGDTPILDYLRGTDPSCSLRAIAEPDYASDTYAVAMPPGFPFKGVINQLLSGYQASGYLDTLKSTWYNDLPCFSNTAAMYKPQALEIETVAGVFVMLFLGILIGVVILLLEHVVFKYYLPGLRDKPKESVFKNRNLMFFSQKLYKFINSVEPVSPHHSAKELVNHLKTGQIMGLFQKSVKRKENEQKRRRKSKAQFFEMIQEIRRVQREGRTLMAASSGASFSLSPNRDQLQGDQPSERTPGSAPSSSPLLASFVRTRRRLSSIFRSEKAAYKSDDTVVPSEGTMETCLDEPTTSVVDTLVVGSSNVGTTAAVVDVVEEKDTGTGAGDQAHDGSTDQQESMSRTLSSTISMQSASNIDRRTLYALSHKSSSTHSALGEFGTAVDLDDPPNQVITNEERTYLESEFLEASANIMATRSENSSVTNTKASKFIPTEILMDESSIQIIQVLPDESDTTSHLSNLCPNHSKSGSSQPYLPPEYYASLSTNTIHSTHSCHSSSIPTHYPLPPFAPPSGIQFDSVSYHVHPHVNHRVYPSKGLSVEGFASSSRLPPSTKPFFMSSHSMSHDSYDVSKDDAGHDSFMKPTAGYTLLNHSHGGNHQPYCNHQHPKSFDYGSQLHHSSQLSKQELWDLLQATEAELRSRLMQTECQRDYYAQQLQVAQHNGPVQRQHSMPYTFDSGTASTRVLSSSTTNYDVPHVIKDSSNLSPMFEFDSSQDRNHYSSTVLDQSLNNIGLPFEKYALNSLTSKTNDWYDRDNKLDAVFHSVDHFTETDMNDTVHERERSKSVLLQRDEATKKRSLTTEYTPERGISSFHQSFGDLQALPKSDQKSSKRRKRSQSRSRRRVFSCTSSSSDSTLGVSCPISRKTPPFSIIQRSRAAMLEESSDSEINVKRRKERRILRKREKYRSCSSQPDTSRQRSDPNVKEAASNLKDVTSSSLYGHLFRSLPDVECIKDDECTTIATEFVYSHTSLHEPINKAEDTETGDFDDLSCIDIPAPKFDDSSSTEEIVKSEPFRSKNEKKPCSTDALHQHQYSAYRRYPQYSGVFQIDSSSSKNSQSQRQVSGERKYRDEADLSPLPILRSLQRQQNRQKEQRAVRQEEDEARKKEIQRLYVENQPVRSSEGPYIIRDGSSLIARVHEKPKRDISARSSRKGGSPQSKEPKYHSKNDVSPYGDFGYYDDRGSWKIPSEKHKVEPSQSHYKEPWSVKEKDYMEAPFRPSTIYLSKSVDDSSYYMRRSLSELREKTSVRYKPNYLAPSSSTNQDWQVNYDKDRRGALPKSSHHHNRQDSYTTDYRDNAFLPIQREPQRQISRSEGIYSSTRHPLMYRDDPKSKSITPTPRRKEKTQHAHQLSTHSFRGYQTSSTREMPPYRSRISTSRAASSENGGPPSGPKLDRKTGSRDDSSHETTTKV